MVSFFRFILMRSTHISIPSHSHHATISCLHYYACVCVYIRTYIHIYTLIVMQYWWPYWGEVWAWMTPTGQGWEHTYMHLRCDPDKLVRIESTCMCQPVCDKLVKIESTCMCQCLYVPMPVCAKVVRIERICMWPQPLLTRVSFRELAHGSWCESDSWERKPDE